MSGSAPLEQIRAVTFDLGETLWHFPDPPPEEAIARHIATRIRHLLGAWGVSAEVDADELDRRLRAARREAERAADAGDHVSPDYVRITGEVMRAAGVELEPWQASELWQAQNVGGPFLGRCLFDDTVETLEWLRRRGVRIAAVTNRSHGGAVFLEELRQDGLLPYFDAVISSDQAGYRKPHPEIFRLALEALGTAAGETAHVGDRVDIDVAGARQAGLVAVWMRRTTPPEHAPNGPDEQPHATIDRLDDLRRVLAF